MSSRSGGATGIQASSRAVMGFYTLVFLVAWAICKLQLLGPSHQRSSVANRRLPLQSLGYPNNSTVHQHLRSTAMA